MEKQGEWAPVLQRMGDYIIRHFGDEMLQEVADCLQGAALRDLHIDPAGDLGLMRGKSIGCMWTSAAASWGGSGSIR